MNTIPPTEFKIDEAEDGEINTHKHFINLNFLYPVVFEIMMILSSIVPYVSVTMGSQVA